MKVLIAEDNVSSCSVYEKVLLKTTDFEICTSASYIQAQDMLKNNKFDVIILDVYLGRDSPTGIDIATKIRKVDLNTQIIVITGYSSDTIIKEAITLDIYDYLKKPIDLNYFAKTTQRAMEKKLLLDERDKLQNLINKTLEDVDINYLESTFKDLYDNKKSFARLSEVQDILHIAVKKLISDNVKRELPQC